MTSEDLCLEVKIPHDCESGIRAFSYEEYWAEWKGGGCKDSDPNFIDISAMKRKCNNFSLLYFTIGNIF